jgi:CDP-paratose 2-epimerase
MRTIIVTGSAGLVGSECVRYYCNREFQVIGVDDDHRAKFFGPEASVAATRDALIREFKNYTHFEIDVATAALTPFRGDCIAIIHTAAQPSHDWASSDPSEDWRVNATGTLGMLEWARKYAPKAAFIFTSTNKVYGDGPNELELRDGESRVEAFEWGYDNEIPSRSLLNGFDESLSIDQCKHSLFGCSKLAADILVQEYGHYFGMNTVSFRCGCLTGPAHMGTKLHGFLSYLVRCAMMGEPYTVIGYNGKQVRDNLHSADLVAAFDEYIKAPRPGEVYNMGGGRDNSCSVREAIRLVEEVSGKAIDVRYEDEPRIGDHKWWITDTRKFQGHYPDWSVKIGLRETVRQIVEAYREAG